MGREFDHSPSYIAEVKMCGVIPPLPQYVFMARCLVKHMDNFMHLHQYVAFNEWQNSPTSAMLFLIKSKNFRRVKISFY